MLPIFRWQDQAFDAWVAAKLPRNSTWIHSLPGQAEQTFHRAKELGIRPALNHASGPIRNQMKLLGESGAVHLDLLAQHEREYELAELHFCASSIVRDQLVASGVPINRIRVVPYAANPEIFCRSLSPNRAVGADKTIMFAGQITARKDPGALLRSLELLGRGDLVCEFYGVEDYDARKWFESYRGKAVIRRYGPVSQQRLASAMQRAQALVLPSLEEGFGLVVPQALACGCPCIVSDRVGSKDLIQHRVNGSIFPVGESEALAIEIEWWLKHTCVQPFEWDWDKAADRILSFSDVFAEKYGTQAMGRS